VDGGQRSLSDVELFLVTAGHKNRVSAFEKLPHPLESDPAIIKPKLSAHFEFGFQFAEVGLIEQDSALGREAPIKPRGFWI
jgi:hypothetical protein